MAFYHKKVKKTLIAKIKLKLHTLAIFLNYSPTSQNALFQKCDATQTENLM
jgi:hypothetical protein